MQWIQMVESVVPDGWIYYKKLYLNLKQTYKIYIRQVFYEMELCHVIFLK